MSYCRIRFQNKQEEIVIKCQRNELMKDIINQYRKKSGLKTNEFDFLYNGTKINMDLTLSQINDEDEEILIIVSQKEIKVNENEIKKTDLIKSAQNTTQVTKTSDASIFFGKKSKVEDFEPFSGMENNSASEITLTIKVERNNVNKTIYFLDDISKSFNQYDYSKNAKKINRNYGVLREIN